MLYNVLGLPQWFLGHEKKFFIKVLIFLISLLFTSFSRPLMSVCLFDIQCGDSWRYNFKCITSAHNYVFTGFQASKQIWSETCWHLGACSPELLARLHFMGTEMIIISRQKSFWSSRENEIKAFGASVGKQIQKESATKFRFVYFETLNAFHCSRFFSCQSYLLSICLSLRPELLLQLSGCVCCFLNLPSQLRLMWQTWFKYMKASVASW